MNEIAIILRPLRADVLRKAEVLAVVDPGKPGKSAPTFRVRCPDCGREYETRCYRRELVGRRRCRSCSDARRAATKNPRAGSSRPPDLPSFSGHPCGTRSKYVAGCRCEPCRAANREYARMRQKLGRAGQGNPLVDAKRVKKHLVKLSRAGVGRRTVADVAGVSATSLHEIVMGRKAKLRRETAAKILAVSPEVLTDAKLVPAASTWRLIGWMLEQGFNRGTLALRLGMKTPALQIRKDFVTARTRAKVEKLYRELAS